MAMTIEGLVIPGRNGRILATYFRADVTPAHPAPIILFCHGLPGNDPFEDLALYLQRRGFHVMTFHYSGSWGSDGEYSLENGLADTNTVLDYLLQREDPLADRSRIYIAAHSLGGFFAAHTYARRPEIKAAALISPANMAAMYTFAQESASAGPASAADSVSADSASAGSLPTESSPGNGDTCSPETTLSGSESASLLSFRAELDDLCAALDGTNADKFFQEIDHHKNEWQFSNIISAIGTRPTLIIRGTQDDITPSFLCADVLKAGLDKIPGSRAELRTFDTPHDYLNVREDLLETVCSFFMTVSNQSSSHIQETRHNAP